jgi:CYTH domain-containing protein
MKMPTSYLHTMIRITDPDATVAFFKLIGLEEVRRFDSEAGRFTLIFLAAPGQTNVAEVELTAIDQTIELPEWIGLEVTEDLRYYNANLVKNPYSSWGAISDTIAIG